MIPQNTMHKHHNLHRTNCSVEELSAGTDAVELTVQANGVALLEFCGEKTLNNMTEARGRNVRAMVDTLLDLPELRYSCSWLV